MGIFFKDCNMTALDTYEVQGSFGVGNKILEQISAVLMGIFRQSDIFRQPDTFIMNNSALLQTALIHKVERRSYLYFVLCYSFHQVN